MKNKTVNRILKMGVLFMAVSIFAALMGCTESRKTEYVSSIEQLLEERYGEEFCVNTIGDTVSVGMDTAQAYCSPKKNTDIVFCVQYNDKEKTISDTYTTFCMMRWVEQQCADLNERYFPGSEVVASPRADAIAPPEGDAEQYYLKKLPAAISLSLFVPAENKETAQQLNAYLTQAAALFPNKAIALNVCVAAQRTEVHALCTAARQETCYGRDLADADAAIAVTFNNSCREGTLRETVQQVQAAANRKEAS